MKENEIREVGAVNIISKGTQIQGSISTSSDCRIDGTVNGNVISRAKVIIGQTGLVEGNISCANIEIEGKVKTESLNVSDLISLKSTASVTGNIIAGKIAIEPGAEFSGNCKMNTQRNPSVMTNPNPAEKK
ncbi:MAG: polymer-forming cytoskeletal protein [Bacteroidales bacterium]|nr:polymer-forming cytoskeletal protein [Bacteroidales bacterium]